MGITNLFIPAAPRLHVNHPQGWGYMIGTDYWMYISANGMLTSGNAHELSDYGWTTTSLVGPSSGSGADFLSSSDSVSGTLSTNAGSDLLQSPSVFGNYGHGRGASIILGYMPTRLNLEFNAAFPVVANNETATCIGFVEDTGSIVTANDALATIFSDATNFKLRSGAATSAAGPAVDTNGHLWRIQLNKTDALAYWWVDDVAQPSLTLETDEFPCAFGFGQVAAGSNTIAMGDVHIWYD